MNLAVFGAKGRVGKKVVELAKGDNVWQIDVDFCHNPLPCVDVAVDFSLPNATEQVVNFCKKYRCPLVTGVTGRNVQQNNLIEELSKCVQVVKKDNFCQGIELLKEICQLVAQKTNWNCEIVETHHAGKKDTPSGTAKMIAGAVAKAQSFKSVVIHSLRIGSNFGRHEVVFGGNGEGLTIIHQAENVEIFARGALQRAREIAKSDKFTF